jgi:hypothetical protein
MKTIPVPGFGGPTYLAVSPVMDAERAINLYPEPGGANSKSPAMLVGRPGLAAWGSVNSVVRGLWAGDTLGGLGRLFAVGGTHVYELASTGAVITDFGAMGGSNVGPVQIVANGDQLMVMNLSAGQIYNVAGGVVTAVYAGRALEYLDGFYIALDAAEERKINVSAYLDGTTWNALDTVVKTGSADRIVQLAVLNGQLWLFGQQTTEIWYNAGNPLFPFARVPGATLNFGCIAPWSVVKFSNTIMWLGCDQNGFMQVFMTQGTNPIRVSNFAIENQLTGITQANPQGNVQYLQYCRGYAYEESGHTFYVLTVMSSHSAPVATYVYDLMTGMWHERVYAGAWPICFASVPQAAFSTVGASFVGDTLSGNIYIQSQGYPSDAGTAITYTRTFPTASDRQHQIKYPLLQLDADMGAATASLEWSNDGGKTFPFSRAAISPSAETSQSNAPRYMWRQLGMGRQRTFRIKTTSSTELVRYINAYMGVSPGTEQ